MPDIVKLTRGEWSAEVNPSMGGNTVRLTRAGRDVLRPMEDPAQWEKEPFLFGSPFLLPANRTDGGTFVFEGKRYTLPLNEPALRNHLHGRIAAHPFVLTEQGQDTVRLALENTGDLYPFPFRLTVTVRLDEAGYRRTAEVKNTGPTDLPFTFGLHTTFPEPDFLRVPLAQAHRRDERHIPTHYEPLNGEEQKIVAGTDPRGVPLSGYYSSGGHVARVGEYEYTVSPNFDHWILFNGGGKRGFLCVEPQAGQVNGLNSGGYLRLSPGQSELFETSLRVAAEKEGGCV